MAKNGSPAKRKKKCCGMKRATQMALYGTSDLLFVYCGGKRETEAVDKRTGSPVAIGPTIATSLSTCPFKWHVYLAVLCRRQDGQQYIKSEEVSVKHPYFRNAIEELLNVQHQELVAKCNPLHIVNIAWIASTTPYEFDDEYCDKLFTYKNAWEFMTPHQEEKLKREMAIIPRCVKCKKFVKRSVYQSNNCHCNKCKGKIV